MLISPKKYLDQAKENFTALPHFNVNNLEMVKSVAKTAQKLNQPAFVAVTENAIKYAGFEYLIGIIKTAGKLTKTDLFLHLDHGRDEAVVSQAIGAGFNSIMYDGSSMPLEENISKTRKFNEQIGDREIVLEAEIGHVGKQTGDRGALSQPEVVAEFADKTGADMIAVSIGTVHGIVEDQKLDYDLLKKIRETVDKPLVVHGCSGLNEDQIKNLIKNGANKFNFDSEIRMAFMTGLKEKIDETDPRKALGFSMKKMSQVIEQKISWIQN